MVQRRIGGLFAVFVVLLGLGCARALYLGFFKAGTLRQAALSEQVTHVPVPALRGTILDRNGVELAISEPADDISATPYLVRSPDAAAAQLAPLLGLPVDHVAAVLAQRGSGFAYIARQVPDATARQVQALHIAGISLTPSEQRMYPDNDLAAQVLGSVGLDGTGLGGLEYSSNGLLGGANGQRTIVSDAIGQPISVTDTKQARPGTSIQLTLDSAIQQRAEDVLAQVGATYAPKDATAIVMDPRTNDILAMANWPRVNANDIGAAPPYARENLAVEMNYEPGSTFKIVAIGGALEDGLVTPDTDFYLPPQIQVADRTIHDAEDRGAEDLTTSGILAQSSNVGAVEIGLKLGATRFDHWVREFGFGSPTGVDLPGEESGIVLPVSRYSGSSMGNLPIGQGESVTPLQIATAYSAIANGGILRAPHVIQAIGGKQRPLPAGHRILSPQVAAEMRQMLKGVLAPGGTAQQVSIPGYQLAGKTGTANKVDPATGQYSTSEYVASFVGFAPAADPKLLVEVIVDQPQGGEIYGAQVAAPAWAQIMSFALPYLKIAPN